MSLYINGLSCISPQPGFAPAVWPFAAQNYDTGRLTCIEPDYTPYIDVKASRRMGRLLKYGTVAGLQALRDAGIAAPDAISTGTGFGLLDDSGKFLRNVTEANEGVVSPTAFIQSTHNTVSSNIALMVGCHGHNNTFAHKGFSFESALTDAQMLMREDQAIKNMLVGAYDELTEYSYAIMQRLGLIRTDGSSLDLLAKPGKGTVTGEGAAFFAMSPDRTDSSYARYHGNIVLHNPASPAAIAIKTDTFLARHGLTISDIDIVISGLCGDIKRDEKLNVLNDSYFAHQAIMGYKHLSGEYMTSSAFALWSAAMIVSTGRVPVEMIHRGEIKNTRNILICNAYKGDYSLILISAC